MTSVVGVKFKNAGKMYYFSPGEMHVEIGDNVITAFAEDGLENLRVDVTFSEAYSGVYDGM